MTPNLALSRADEWSTKLDKNLLREAFVPRPHLDDIKSQGAPTGSLLLKFLAHRPSKTLCLVVLPLNTCTPLYEGLSFRTLQRRFRSSPPWDTAAQTQNADDEDGLFDLLAERVGQAVRGGTNDSWLECEMGRGEASLTLHCTCNDSIFSIAFDLSSLDRDEGPAFIRHHLLEPLADLALQTPGQPTRNGDHTGGSPLMSLLRNADRSRQLLIAGAALQGLSVLQQAAPRADVGGATPQSVQKTPSDSTVPQPHSPSPPRTPSPLASADHTADPGSSTLNDNAEDMILLLRPTQTPKKTTKLDKQGAAKDEATSRSSLPLSPSPSPSPSPSRSGTKSNSRAQEGRRMPSIPTSTTDRDGEVLRGKDDKKRGGSHSSSDPSSATNLGYHNDDDDDDDDAPALPSKERGEKRRRASPSSSSSSSSSSSLPAASDNTPGQSKSSSPGAAMVKSRESKVRDGDQEQDQDQEQEQEQGQEAVQRRHQDGRPPASVSTPATAKSTTTTTASTRGSRGSSTYTRGLAKKKRL